MARYAWTGEYGRVWIAAALGGALVDRRRRTRWLWAAVGVPLTLAMNFCVKAAVRRASAQASTSVPWSRHSSLAAGASRPKIESTRPLQGSHLAAAESLPREVREQSADLSC